MSGGNSVRLIGKAGEHIACADLFVNGWIATIATEGQAYDIIAERGGQMVRVAVKTTMEARPRRKGARDAYRFFPERRQPTVRRRLEYTRAETDLIALVALDIRRVGYIAVDQCPKIIWIYCDHAEPANRRFGPKVSCMRRFDQLKLEDALNG